MVALVHIKIIGKVFTPAIKVLVVIACSALTVSCQSSDQPTPCERLVSLAKEGSFVGFNWSRAKMHFNKPLPKYSIAYYRDKPSIVEFYFSAMEDAAWSSVGVSVHLGYITMVYKDKYEDETKKRKIDIKVQPYMIEKIYVGDYQERLLFILKHPNSEHKNDVNKLKYDLYVECNGRPPENSDTVIEPEAFIKIEPKV